MARSEPTLFLSWNQAVSNNLKWRISERIPLTHLSKNKQRLQTIKEWPRIKPLSVLIVKKKKKKIKQAHQKIFPFYVQLELKNCNNDVDKDAISVI